MSIKYYRLVCREDTFLKFKLAIKEFRRRNRDRDDEKLSQDEVLDTIISQYIRV